MTSAPTTSYPILKAILVGGLVAGVLDITYAITAYGLIGVPARAILQSIASGWLGKTAYSGGWPVAMLGLASHLFITCVMAGIFVAAARRVSQLCKQPLLSGMVFGLCAFVVMNQVVVPLSAAAVRPPRGWFLAGDLLSHMFLVGAPIAFAARRAQLARSGDANC
jgi:uncharacterized membrane protein YagU involved in acid resistance